MRSDIRDFYPQLKVGYARLVTLSTDGLLQVRCPPMRRPPLLRSDGIWST